MVSGSLARISTSMARFCTSISGSRSSGTTAATSMGPSMRDSAVSAAERIILLLSRSWPCSAALDVRLVELRQDVDDVHPGDGILALDATGEFPETVLIGDLGDDAEQRRLLVGLLRIGGRQQLPQVEPVTLSVDDLEQRGFGYALRVQRIQQQPRRVAAIAGESPGDAGRDARATVAQALQEQRKGLVGHQGGEHIDQRHGGVLVGVGKGWITGSMAPGPMSLSLATDFRVSSPRGLSADLIWVISRSERRFVKKPITASVPSLRESPGLCHTGPPATVATRPALLESAPCESDHNPWFLGMNELDDTASARAAINAHTDPYAGNLGDIRAIAGLTVTAAEVRLSLRLPVPVLGYAPPLQAALQKQLEGAGMTQRLVLDLTADIATRAVQKPLKPMAGIRNIIAVGSAKGGGGQVDGGSQSGAGLGGHGCKGGLLDADIYGPSQPLLLGGRGPTAGDRGEQAHSSAAGTGPEADVDRPADRCGGRLPSGADRWSRRR